ncbi:MAG: AAA family ATPase [Anaerolineaceae bacterium]|nr:AAA family ATPase [Anaerolineaceae bacterium]
MEDHADTVIVIDEIDYAFKHESLLGTIRDIVDQTMCIVILVGMQSAKDRLAQINPHYFDCCSCF